MTGLGSHIDYPVVATAAVGAAFTPATFNTESELPKRSHDVEAPRHEHKTAQHAILVQRLWNPDCVRPGLAVPQMCHGDAGFAMGKLRKLLIYKILV